jgi:hypothetical protein
MYKLYNYTANPANPPVQTYNATTRTVKIRGFALNAVFDDSIAFTRRLPLVVKWIDPDLYNSAGTKILNMTGANYFYIISYPTYSGFKVVHDPTYTMYYAPAAAPSPPTGLYGLIALILIIAIIAVTATLVLRRRKTGQTPKQQ